MDSFSISCFICTSRVASAAGLHQHLMYQHSMEDIAVGLVFCQLQHKAPLFLLDTSPFDFFLGKYPHLRPQPMDASSSLLLRSPDIFASCSPLLNYISSSTPSTPVLNWQQKDALGMQMLTPLQQPSEPLDLSPTKKCAPLLSQRTDDSAEIDIVSLSQHSQGTEGAAGDDERRYRCADCTNSYKLKAHLTRHRKSAHSADRPHVCEFCTKAFKLKELLNQHVQTHGVARPFRCEVCRGTFRYAAELKKHRVTQHADRVHGCPHCKLLFSAPSAVYTHLSTRHGCRLQCHTCGDDAHTTPSDLLKVGYTSRRSKKAKIEAKRAESKDEGIDSETCILASILGDGI